MELKQVKNRNDLEKFAQTKGYKVNNRVIPIDFYKKEINLVNFAKDALGYEVDSSKSGRRMEDNKSFYLKRHGMKDQAVEDPLYASSKMVVMRKNVSPGHKDFKFNGQYYFSQALAYAGEKHGSVIDLVQMHYNTDFKGSLRIIDNFLIHNKVVKENFNNAHIAKSSVDGKSEVRRIFDYNNIKPFHDDSFLKSRGLREVILKDPRFKDVLYNQHPDDGKHVNTAFMISSNNGLIGFEVRNEGFKSVLDQKQDGFVRSVVDHSKPVDNLVLGESFIDVLSKAQLESDKSNSLFLSSAGNITGRQIALLQEFVDKGISAKAVYTHKLTPEMIPNVVHTKNVVDGGGVVQLDEKGEPLTVSYVSFNQPKKLVTAFDNDQAGKMITIKTLGKLKSGGFFEQKNSALANSEISVYSNKTTHEGRISWRMGEGSLKKTSEGLSKVITHFNKLNEKYQGVLAEGIPFKLKREGKEVEIRFAHSTKQWEYVLDSVKQIKYNNSPKLQIDKPITKDFNQDLKGRLGIDPVAKRQIDIALLSNKVASMKQETPINSSKGLTI